MRAIIVDDEPLMIRKFTRLTADFDDLEILAWFDDADEAIDYAKDHEIDVAFLDVEMPEKNGIQLARELRLIRRNMIIVFITAFEEYIRESNEIGGDDYILKPYTRDILALMMEKMRVLITRQQEAHG